MGRDEERRRSRGAERSEWCELERGGVEERGEAWWGMEGCELE